MKVAVAMSGGVDSSVAAVLLIQKGFDVIGVTMKHYNPQKAGFPDSEGIDIAIYDATEVCKQLNIKHYVFDVQEKFEEIIIENFIGEYKNGKTPNPCTLCNPTIKWGAFFEQVFELGVDKMATGHYLKLQEEDNKCHLYRADDKNKDQSYMLWRLNQDQLSKTIFPISNYSKPQIRQIAEDNDLHIAQRKDSQEICFFYGTYHKFLKKHLKSVHGNILFKNGDIIGRHAGTINYTIGQRKGLNTPWKSALFVKEIDAINNSVIVTDDLDDLLKKDFVIKEINWISGEEPPVDNLEVQIRYNSNTNPVKNISKVSDGLKIELVKPVRAITSGQSAVFYCGEELLGGGVIV